MNFREYRPKETIRAAEITEDKIMLVPESGAPTPIEFGKGDYVELRDGRLLGWAKIEFEATYLPTRAPRTVKTKKEKRKTNPVTLASLGAN